LISRKTGLYTEPDPKNPDGHTPSLLVGNEVTGQWMRNSATDNPKFLARTIGDWLNSWQTAKKTGISFADAPALNFDRGEYTFNNHCAACHSIGKGDRIGPDLAGVTATRDREWLTMFILTPDKVLAAGDPIAVALRAKYKDVRMPNLSLSESDTRALLEYMDRGGRPATPAADVPAAATVKPPVGDVSMSTAAILEAYSTIHQALNADRMTGVAQAAGTIAAESAKAGDAFAPVRTAAAAMQSAADLAAARTAMGPLSDALIALSRAGAKLDAVKPAYCPMARKYWLQRGDKIQNPYYGQSMSDCGRFADSPQK
jgi:mono/diheme cytochrome c family protein